MDKFDRTLQRELLMKLYDSYPEGISDDVSKNIGVKFGTRNNYLANLQYLRESGLIDCQLIRSESGHYSMDTMKMRITNKGIDFVRDDGGLSAILNVQTIKFHREAVVVLEDLIAMSNMNDEQKEKAKSTLGELPAEALKTVVQTATTAVLSKLFGQ